MKVKLESFLQEIREKTTENNQYPVLTSSKAGLYLQSDYFNKQVASKDNTGYKIIKKGQFTYRAMSDTGEFFPNMLECTEIGIVSPAYPVFKIASPVIIPEYLKYYFKSNGFQQSISSFAQGSTRTSIKYGKLKTVSMDLPSLDEQRKAIEILNRVDKIIDECKQKSERYDELIKARFVEMFGDPRLNEKGFKCKKGFELFKISNGKAVPNGKRYESGIPAYGGNGISWYTDTALFEEDTIVIGRVGFQSGNVHFVKGPMWITDNAMYISELYDDSFNLVFLCDMMEQIDFTRHQDAGDLKKVTQKPFMEMEYILPAKSLQKEYIDFVNQVNKSKVVVEKMLNEAQILFNSLMQEYFG